MRVLLVEDTPDLAEAIAGLPGSHEESPLS
jgi:hypothetical protein